MTSRQTLKALTPVTVIVKDRLYYALPVPSYHGYLATTTGEIISCVSHYNGRGARINKAEPHILKAQDSGTGYKKVTLTTREGKPHQELVHRIVARTFLEDGGCDRDGSKRLQVNHINAVTNDNRLCNLEYVTAKENAKWAILLNTVKEEVKYADQ